MFKLRHQYKRRQILKIIKRHLYYKRPLTEFINYEYEQNKDKIDRMQMDVFIKGVGVMTQEEFLSK